MEAILLKIAAAAVAIFAAEMALSLLPEGNMKKFGKFVVGILLFMIVVGAFAEHIDIHFTAESPETSQVTYESYKDIIMDVYNQYLRNKNK